MGTIVRRSGRRFTESHLSRVERGQRAVTPAMIAAYEQALGLRLPQLLATHQPNPTTGNEQASRQAFLATIGVLAVGGPPGRPIEQLAAAAAAAAVDRPRRIGTAELTHIQHAAAMVHQLDLAYGGRLASQLGTLLLRWALPLRRTATGTHARQLDTAISALAATTGWAMFDAGQQPASRHLYTIALETATTADDADQRGHILADLATAHQWLGHPHESHTLLRLALGDHHLTSPTRALLHSAAALAHAHQNNAHDCLHHIAQAQTAAAQTNTEAAEPDAGARAVNTAHIHARCGHALAVLAHPAGDHTHRHHAVTTLATAADQLLTTGRMRAATRCYIQLAKLHLPPPATNPTDHDQQIAQAADWIKRALHTSTQLHSTRVTHELTTLHTTIAQQPPHPTLQELAHQLQQATNPNPPE